MSALSTAAIPQFETERLLLRAPTLEDVTGIQAHFVDYEVIRVLARGIPWPYPEDGAETWLNEKVIPVQGSDKWVWGIYLKTQPLALIGVVDLWRPGTPENRGFWLGRKFWGRGLMSEAVEPVMDFAFDELGFEALVFSNAVGNIGSRRVKEKTGAQFIGVRPAEFVDPQYSESEMWRLTKEEWRRHKARR